MKPLPIVYSDQPYLPGQPKNQTKFREHSLYSRRRRKPKENRYRFGPQHQPNPTLWRRRSFIRYKKKFHQRISFSQERHPKRQWQTLLQRPRRACGSPSKVFGETLCDFEEVEERETALVFPDMSLLHPLRSVPLQQKLWRSTALRTPTTQPLRILKPYIETWPHYSINSHYLDNGIFLTSFMA